jgi:hypothetical protein
MHYRRGVVFIFFLFWVVVMGAGTALGLRTPRTVKEVEQRWHGPAHEHPADYARDYK